MADKLMILADGDDVRQLGALVEGYMKDANLTTEWVRETSHFGHSTFARFKKANCIM